MSKTWRNILTIALDAVLLAALAAYFYGADILRETGRKNEKCSAIRVTLLDSALNKFVSKNEVVEIITGYDRKVIGRRIDSINLQNIETALNKRSVVKESQVSVTRDGIMNVSITQRRPVIRIEGAEGGFYIDETAYFFPLIEKYTSYVPVVSGNLPVRISAEEQKIYGKDSTEWLDDMVSLGKFLESNPFWNSQIEQIYFDTNGDAVLSTRAGTQKIILGNLKDLPEKFEKLNAFYQCVIPKFGWDKYRVINLKYKKQIVCTRGNSPRAQNRS